PRSGESACASLARRSVRAGLAWSSRWLGWARGPPPRRAWREQDLRVDANAVEIDVSPDVSLCLSEDQGQPEPARQDEIGGPPRAQRDQDDPDREQRRAPVV